MKNQKTFLAGVLVATCALLAGPQTMAQDRAEAGVLACHQVGSRINLIIHSTAKISCVFTDINNNVEQYVGETGVGLGIDLQWKKEEHMAFTVLAAITANAGDHALTGKYVGGGASAPLMAAGVTDRLWDIEDIVRLVDEAAPKSGPRGPYKKINSN